MNNYNQAYSNPEYYYTNLEAELESEYEDELEWKQPLLETIYKGGGQIKIEWQQMLSLDAAVKSIDPKYKGVYQVLLNGNPIYNGQGNIQRELREYLRAVRITGGKPENYTVRYGLMHSNYNKDKRRLVERHFISRDNKRAADQHRRKLANNTSTGQYGAAKDTTIASTVAKGIARRNIPPALRSNKGQQTLKKGKLYEAEWLFEMPLAHEVPDFIHEIRWE